MSPKHHKLKVPTLPEEHPRLHLISTDPPIDIRLDLGDGGATPTGGLSGYGTVPRQGRKAMTAYEGEEPFQQDVPVFVDGYSDDKSIELTIRRIFQLGGKTIFVAHGPIFKPGIRYVYGSTPDFNGSESIRDETGELQRMEFTLHLMEYVPGDQAGPKKRRVPKHQRGEPGKTGGTAYPGYSYTTVEGDTLIKVAQKLYGEWEEWKAIGKKNGLTDPHKVLKPGTRLLLP